jgi:predicted ATPase
MYLKQFKLKEELYTIKPFTIDFKDGLNLIVGDNGSGKSTLLKMLFDQDFENGKKELILTDECQRNGVESKFFDTEKENPRIQDLEMYTNPDGTNRGIGVGNALMSRFLSHGEVIFPIVNAIKIMKNIVIFIDEPEAAVSLKNQKLVFKSIMKAVKNKCQVFISTHSYILIKNAGEVYDMETGEWIESGEYLKKFEI